MSINNHSGDNISEVTNLWLISSLSVNSFPEENSNFEVDFTDFSLKSGKNFEKIYFSANSCIFKEEDKDSQNGPYVEKSIVAKIPKSRSEVSAWLNTNRHLNLHCVILDANGNFFLIRDNMRLTFSRTSPKQSNEFGGYEIKLSCKAPKMSPIINNCTLQ